jgi:hypothetical protein
MSLLEDAPHPEARQTRPTTDGTRQGSRWFNSVMPPATALFGFTHDEYVDAFRHLGVARAEASEAADRLFAADEARTPLPETLLDADLLAALSLVSPDCERRARVWIETLDADRAARTRLSNRFAHARLVYGGRVDRA